MKKIKFQIIFNNIQAIPQTNPFGIQERRNLDQSLEEEIKTQERKTIDMIKKSFTKNSLFYQDPERNSKIPNFDNIADQMKYEILSMKNLDGTTTF